MMWTVMLGSILVDGLGPMILIVVGAFIGVARDMSDVPTQIGHLESQFRLDILIGWVKEHRNVCPASH